MGELLSVYMKYDGDIGKRAVNWVISESVFLMKQLLLNLLLLKIVKQFSLVWGNITTGIEERQAAIPKIKTRVPPKRKVSYVFFLCTSVPSL